MHTSKTPVPVVEARDRSRHLISPWAILGAFLIGACLLGLTFAAVWTSRPGPGQTAPSTAELVVVRAPTATSPVPSAMPTEPNPDSQDPPPPAPGNIAVGTLVQVAGTGGDGLRVRSEPGLEGKILFLGLESEVFQVTDGPREVDGYTWWLLAAPYDPSVSGWAVANYLTVVQNP